MKNYWCLNTISPWKVYQFSSQVSGVGGSVVDFLFVCFVGHTWSCSGDTSGSTLRDNASQCLWDYIQCKYFFAVSYMQSVACNTSIFTLHHLFGLLCSIWGQRLPDNTCFTLRLVRIISRIILIQTRPPGVGDMAHRLILDPLTWVPCDVNDSSC